MRYNFLFLISIHLFIISLSCKQYSWNPLRDKNHPHPHIAGLILARGGSKGIRMKNLARVGGKTLLKRALEETLPIKGFSSVWVSTDNPEIYEETASFSDVHWRSPETATDDASSLLAVQEFLSHHKEVDIVALIQCTSPFIKSKYLQEAINFAFRKHFQCAFAVTRSHKLRWKKLDNLIRPLNFNLLNRPRRQDFQDEFVENGMFYFAKRELVRKGYLQSNG